MAEPNEKTPPAKDPKNRKGPVDEPPTKEPPRKDPPLPDAPTSIDDPKPEGAPDSVVTRRDQLHGSSFAPDA